MSRTSSPALAVVPPPDPRRTALNAALQSNTLSRSEQLRNFLRFVCEKEIEGSASEISEYNIGVSALGRPANFSPSEDSTVRTRAHLLRQKLSELYEKELPDSPHRIELPRGSYVPRFQATEPKAPPPPPPDPPLLNRYPKAILGGAIGAGLIAGVALVLTAGWYFGFTRTHLDRIVASAWGPLATTGADVMVCIASPAHLAMRTLKSDPPPWMSQFEVTPELRTRVFSAQKRWQDADVFIEFTEHTARMGEVFAAARMSQVLDSAGVQPHMMTTNMIRSAAFSGRNLIVIGSPDFDGATRKLLEKGAFTIGWNSEAKDTGVLERGTGNWRLPERDGKNQIVVSYGLITVIPSDGSPGGQHRTLVVSGVTSAGAHAAMEYFSSAPNLTDLRQKFRAEGSSDFPAAYQVVIRCSAANDRMVSYQYVAHRKLDTAALQR